MASLPLEQNDQNTDSVAPMFFRTALVISLLVHLGALLCWQAARDRFPEEESVAVPLQIVLAPRVVAPVTESKPVSPADPEPVEGATVEPQPAAAGESPADERHTTEAAGPPPAPAQMSILQRVEDYVANLPLSSEYLPQDANTGPDNIFHPSLRRALRAPEGGRPALAPRLLNNSIVADSYERVSLDGKCFRLEDLGGGADKRAWYPVKCKGSESTSDAMARGLEEALERR